MYLCARAEHKMHLTLTNLCLEQCLFNEPCMRHKLLSKSLCEMMEMPLGCSLEKKKNDKEERRQKYRVMLYGHLSICLSA